MNCEIMRNAILQSGLMSESNSKQDIYIAIKRLVDNIYMQDITKCVNDVCNIHQRIFDDLSEQEISDLHDVAEDLCHYMSQAVDNGLSTELLEKVRNYFSYINMTIEFNNDTLVIAKSMQKFYQLVYDYRDEFIQLEQPQVELVSCFVNDFKKWIHLTFISKTGNPHFLDNSILANYDLIENMIIKLDDEEEISLEDIFNF